MQSDYLNNLCRTPLPPFDTTPSLYVAPSIQAVPRLQSTPNIGKIIAFTDPESEYQFDLLKVEEQDDINRLWKGIKLDIKDDSEYYIAESAEELEVPMSCDILNNVKINRDGTLAKTSAKGIAQILKELELHGSTEQVRSIIITSLLSVT